jgi:site-specific recombinase XerD
MASLRPPRAQQRAGRVLTADEIESLRKTCGKSRDFVSVRDDALLAFFLSTGCREGEVEGLRVGDVDLKEGLAIVVGKGDRRRCVVLDAECRRAIDRYRRVRITHPKSHIEALWLGGRGALGQTGIFQAMRKRGERAGIDRLATHDFRRTFAVRWMADGGTETGLMRIAGWSDTAMIRRYTQAVATNLAIDEARRIQAKRTR